jgi:hypothetical protein
MPVHQKNNLPDFMPVLSVGRHRTPRTGGCFMEFASYLAGEKWSDHPSCTHPTLALLARLINDCTAETERSKLAELIPSVIGLTSDDPRMELRIALRAATMALPIASEVRQRALAVGITATQSQLAELGPLADTMWAGAAIAHTELAARVTSAFAQAPAAEQWARGFVAEHRVDGRGRAVTPVSESIIRTAVIGIAQACSPDTNERLRVLLRDAIEDCRIVVDSNSAAVQPSTPVVVGPGLPTFVASRRRHEVPLPTR